MKFAKVFLLFISLFLVTHEYLFCLDKTRGYKSPVKTGKRKSVSELTQLWESKSDPDASQKRFMQPPKGKPPMRPRLTNISRLSKPPEEKPPKLPTKRRKQLQKEPLGAPPNYAPPKRDSYSKVEPVTKEFEETKGEFGKKSWFEKFKEKRYKKKLEKAKKKAEGKAKRYREKLEKTGELEVLKAKPSGHDLRKDFEDTKKEEARKKAEDEKYKYIAVFRALEKMENPTKEQQKAKRIFDQEVSYNLMKQKGVKTNEIVEFRDAVKNTEISAERLMSSEEDYRSAQSKLRDAEDAYRTSDDNLKMAAELLKDESPESLKMLDDLSLESARRFDILNTAKKNFEKSKKERDLASKGGDEVFDALSKKEDELLEKLGDDVKDRDELAKLLDGAYKSYIRREAGEQEIVEKLYNNTLKQVQAARETEGLRVDIESEGLSGRKRKKLEKESKKVLSGLETEQKKGDLLISDLERGEMERELLSKDSEKLLEKEKDEAIDHWREELASVPSVEDVFEKKMGEEIDEGRGVESFEKRSSFLKRIKKRFSKRKD